MAEPVTLIVSVDVEEDNWAPVRDGITVENVRELPRLDRVLERVGARATYFTTHAVASIDWSAGIMRELWANGRAEIGAHLHPWNTPPLYSDTSLRFTMMANLPAEQQLAKLRVLTDQVSAISGERPHTFRAGRWGFDSRTVDALVACGYRVDSSVTPFKSWTRHFGPSHVGAPLDVYRLDGQSGHWIPAPNGPLIEVPTSWGYLHESWDARRMLNRALDAPVLRPLRLLRLAARLHILDHVVLSPELDTVAHMEKLARRLIRRGVRHLHLTLHSSTLRPGLTPFAATQADVDRVLANLAEVIERIGAMADVRFATVGEAAALLAPKIYQ